MVFKMVILEEVPQARVGESEIRQIRIMAAAGGEVVDEVVQWPLK